MFVILSSWHNEFICQVYLPIIEQRQEITNPQIKLTEVGPLAAIVHTRRRYLILLLGPKSDIRVICNGRKLSHSHCCNHKLMHEN